MTKRAWLAALAFALAPLASCDSDSASELGETRCSSVGEPDRDAILADKPCELLSSYGFFTDLAAQTPSERVVPYDLNSALFSDYATKQRFLWIPEGEVVGYAERGPLDLPVGAVVIKTFAFAGDLRDPAAGQRLIETRLLVHQPSGWQGRVYRWNQAQDEAHLNVAGGIVPVRWTHTDGAERELGYIVPNVNQCEGCHTDGETSQLIGPQARHLNRDFDYPTGAANQLAHLAELGLLVGAPADPREAPRTAVWDDPSSGTVEERARAWLDINCAHCHNPAGPARTSGLDLSASQTEPRAFGVCKTPVAAGAGSGGLRYNIVPGQPDESILVLRLEATTPAVRMPELLRQTVHDESALLIREWIASLEGDCE